MSPDPRHHTKLNIWQICIVMILISIAVHVAFQRLPELAKPATIWLIQALVAWCGGGGVVAGIIDNDHVANQTLV